MTTTRNGIGRFRQQRRTAAVRLQWKFAEAGGKMSRSDEDKQWIGERLDQVGSRIGHVETRIEQVNARIGPVETRLLTKFHQWASPVEMRLRTHTAALQASDLALEGVAGRVTKLEGPEAQ